jgi:hypothetical protein
MCPKNEYQGFPLGVKEAGAWGWRPTTLVVPNVKRIRDLNLPGTPVRPLRPLVGVTFMLFLLVLWRLVIRLQGFLILVECRRDRNTEVRLCSCHLFIWYQLTWFLFNIMWFLVDIQGSWLITLVKYLMVSPCALVTERRTAEDSWHHCRVKQWIGRIFLLKALGRKGNWCDSQRNRTVN